MHTYIHTYVYIYIYIYIHTHIQKHIQTYIHTYVYGSIASYHAHFMPYTHMYTCIHKNAYIHPCKCRPSQRIMHLPFSSTYIHIYIHACIQVQAVAAYHAHTMPSSCTYIHIHIHAYTCTHMQVVAAYHAHSMPFSLQYHGLGGNDKRDSFASRPVTSEEIGADWSNLFEGIRLFPLDHKMPQVCAVCICVCVCVHVCIYVFMHTHKPRFMY